MSDGPAEDIALCQYGLAPRIQGLRKAYFDAIPEVCIERPVLLTRFHLANGLLGKRRITILDKALAYRYVLENRRAIVWPRKAYDGLSQLGGADVPLLEQHGLRAVWNRVDRRPPENREFPHLNSTGFRGHG